MRKARHSNRALVVVSDGQDYRSIYNSPELYRAFADSPVPIYLILTQERWSGARIDPWGAPTREDLVRLANQSGGYSMSVFSNREAIEAATQLAFAIRMPYVLFFVSQWPRGADRVRELSIEVNRVRPRPRVYHRTMYYAQPH